MKCDKCLRHSTKDGLINSVHIDYTSTQDRFVLVKYTFRLCPDCREKTRYSPEKNPMDAFREHRKLAKRYPGRAQPITGNRNSPVANAPRFNARGAY